MKASIDIHSSQLRKSPVDILRDAYMTRRAKNSAYSMNSFAIDLGISKSLLSRIFSGERPVSMKLAVQISTALELNEVQSRSILFSVIQSSSKNSKISQKIKARLEKDFSDTSFSESSMAFTTVEIERFKAMACWHHLALINLTTLKSFKSEPQWIASQLGITTLEVREAIDRLLALGLLHEVDGVLKRSIKSIYIKTQQSEFAVRKFHEQMITKAKGELKNTSTEAFNRRLINGITFACSKDQIELIKDKIDKFQDEILKLVSHGENEELYQMNVQFFPLTKVISGEQK